MIKKLHTHDEEGRVCYVSTNVNERQVGMYIIDGEEVVIAYNSYSAMYHAYNVDTGYGIASFRKEFYDKHIKRFKDGELEPTKNCIK